MFKSMPMKTVKNILSLIKPLYWPAWLGLLCLWLITRLPLPLQIRIGQFLGKIIYLVSPKLKRIAEVNITLCFPELTSPQRQELIRKNFASLGIGIIEAGMAWWVSDNKLKSYYQITGMEYVEQALAKGKGIILISPHFTCLEIVGRILGLHHSFAVMYRPHKKPFISFIHKKFREKHYVNYIPSHNVRQLIKTLNNNMPIWYAYDIDGGAKRSVFAPFFGIPTATLTAVSRLAKLTDTTLVPISFYRSDDNCKYEIVLSKPLDNFPGDNYLEDATRLNATVEAGIRRKPEQYIWQYKRFKTRPKGEKRFY